MSIDFKGPHERALIRIENAIVRRILSNTPPPNAQSTIAKKGSSKTLIDTGEMLGHVTHRQAEAPGGLVGEVGILDEKVAVRAAANEFGVPWGQRPGAEENTREWFIPPRPFLRPAFDETAHVAAEEMAEEIFGQIEKRLRW